jgi:dihydrofolate synthase/folylpolyglutamate synthase
MERWQVLGRHPLIICDTGHNEGGLREVVGQIARIPYRKLHFVFGAVNDKDLTVIFRLLPPDARYYFCKPDIPRGLDAVELKTRAMEAGLNGQAYASVREAKDAALLAAGESDLVFISGSIFVVAEVV